MEFVANCPACIPFMAKLKTKSKFFFKIIILQCKQSLNLSTAKTGEDVATQRYSWYNFFLHTENQLHSFCKKLLRHPKLPIEEKFIVLF